MQKVYDSEIGKDLKIDEIIKSWITKIDIPVLSVERDYGTTNVKLKINEEARWIPFNYRHQLLPLVSTIEWFNKSEHSIDILNLDDSNWILFNLDQIGFYRVNYDTKNWELIKTLLQSDHTQLSDKTRTQLIDDSFSLSRSGDLPYSTAFDLMIYLKSDSDFLPWKAAIDNLRPLSWLMYKTDAFNNFTVILKVSLYFMTS